MVNHHTSGYLQKEGMATRYLLRYLLTFSVEAVISWGLTILFS